MKANFNKGLMSVCIWINFILCTTKYFEGVLTCPTVTTLCFMCTEKRILIAGPTKHLLVIWDVLGGIDISEYEPLQYTDGDVTALLLPLSMSQDYV